MIREPGDLPCANFNPPSGMTGNGVNNMTAQTKTAQSNTQAQATSPLAAITVVFLAGAGLLFAAGIAQATVLHDAAHDTRHAMAFPCH